MSTKTKRKPQRAPHDQLTLLLSPEDGARARGAAADYGMTLTEYVATLIRGEQRFPVPASHARLGGCILDAVWALEQPEPNVAEAVRLLREAQRFGAEFARAQLPAFNASHTLDVPWDSPDRPERRA
jgi:hypothetical protein